MLFLKTIRWKLIIFNDKHVVYVNVQIVVVFSLIQSLKLTKSC